MRTASVVVGHPFAQDFSQVTFVERNQPVQTLGVADVAVPATGTKPIQVGETLVASGRALAFQGRMLIDPSEGFVYRPADRVPMVKCPLPRCHRGLLAKRNRGESRRSLVLG